MACSRIVLACHFLCANSVFAPHTGSRSSHVNAGTSVRTTHEGWKHSKMQMSVFFSRTFGGAVARPVCVQRQRQLQPCMPHWAACVRHKGKIVKLLPIYINPCKTRKIQAGLNAKVRHQLQRPPMKVNFSSGKSL